MRAKTDARRNAIVAAAWAEFREQGFERTTMSDINARAGGSKATLYSYFASKDELFLAALEHGLKESSGEAFRQLLTKPGADIKPIAPMDHTDRRNAMARVSIECGMGRHAANDPNAAPLQFLKSGVWTAKAKDHPLDMEFGMSGGEFGYGECWGRPTLGYRIRCLITVAGLQSLFANDQLCFHINTALNLGVTQEELHEVFAHVGIYAGIANWRNAANVAREVFLQRGLVEPA